MLERIKKLRNERRRKPHVKLKCLICQVPMKRKGKKGPSSYFKCTKCGAKLMPGGLFIQAPNPDTLDMRNYEIKAMRKEMAKRKFIKWAKRQKYLGYDEFEWEGEIVKLKEYDMDGISFEEKKRLEEERKKAEKEQKKAERKKKAKKTKKKRTKSKIEKIVELSSEKVT